MTERPKKILITEAEQLKTDDVSQDGINRVRKAMWWNRMKTQPALPKTRQEALSALSTLKTKDSTVIDTDIEHEIAWI